MNTRKFLENVWPSVGPYCIATPWITPSGDKTYVHKTFDDITDVLAYLTEKRNHVDMYFAIHTLRVARQVNPSTGRLKTFRTHENMKEAKAYFFDLDVGPMEEGKLPKYATQGDAREGLEHFLFMTGLPTPYVTSSGTGLHVYWMLDDPIESETWRTPADKLHWLAIQHGLRADPSRTTDQSSVLRVPNTFNFKDPHNLRKVEVLLEGETTPTLDFIAAIDTLCGDRYVPVQYLKAAGTPHSRAETKPWDGRFTPADELAEVCEQMRIFRDTQGRISEPHWHVGIGVMKYTENGENTIHEWSQGHSNYDFGETQTKIDNWGTWPPTCRKIRSSCDASVCDRCPFNDGGMGTNPIVIANKVWEQRAAPPPQLQAQIDPAPVSNQQLVLPPWPWQRTPQGIIEHLTNAKAVDGSDDPPDPGKPKFRRICNYDIFPIISYDKTDNERGFSKWAVTLPILGQRIMKIPNHAFQDHKLMSAALFEEHVIIAPPMSERMFVFMKAYLAELQKSVAATRQYDFIGWDVNEGAGLEPKGFILPGKRLPISGGPSEPIALTSTTDGVKRYMTQTGSRDAQIDLMEFYNHPDFMAHQFVIGAALGTPLVLFSDQIGFVINITGPHSASKSFALYFASSLFGDPKTYGISGLRSGGTEKGTIIRRAIMRNLPFMIDEITLMDPEYARQIVLGASQPGDYVFGTQTRSMGAPRGGVKAGMIICTANNSLTQLVNIDNKAANAATARIIELKVGRSDARSKAEADDVMRALVENHGWIGEEFIHRSLAGLDKVRANFLKAMQRIEAAAGIDATERFLSVAGAAAIYATRRANRMGLLPYDASALESWWIEEQIPTMRRVMSGETDRRSPENILSDYLNEINGKISKVELDAKKQIAGVVQIPNGELYAHIDVGSREIWVRCDPFRRYCQRNGFDYASTLDTLRVQGFVIGANERKVLAQGTVSATSRTICFVVSLKALGMVADTPAIDGEPDDTVVPFKPRAKK